MRAKSLTPAAATAVILVGPTLVSRAAAMTLVGASAPRVAAGEAACLRVAAVICGADGCARVHTSRARPHRPRP